MDALTFAFDLSLLSVLAASSRVLPEDCRSGNTVQGAFYGERGESLQSIVSLAASVEIESRTLESWTSHRKVFQVSRDVDSARSLSVVSHTHLWPPSMSCLARESDI